MDYAVIVAGDLGETLRPLTSEDVPTPFLALGGRRSLLQQHVDRLSHLLPHDRIVVAVRPRHEALTRDQVPSGVRIYLDAFEGGARSVAAAAVSALGVAGQMDVSVLIQPSTHAVQDEEAYESTIREGLDMTAHARVVVRFIDRSPLEQGDIATGIAAYPLEILLAACGEASGGPLAGSDALGESAGTVKDLSLTGAGWLDLSDWRAVHRLLKYVEKPWGHERLWALNEHYAGKILFIKAGESLSLQFHEVKDETIRIASGRMRFREGEVVGRLRSVILEPGMSFLVPPRRIHQMEAVEDCTVVEVSTPQLADVVRLQDRYGRA